MRAPIADERDSLLAQTEALVASLIPDPTRTEEGGLIGYGWGPGYKGLIFTLRPVNRGVSLGVANGAFLDDPARLLQGTGKRHRHVTLRSQAELARPELLDLLTRAAARAIADG
jgi:hypothetical protein